MSPENTKEVFNRLCSEIQLFDLCDLESCSSRSNKFCTDEELLTRFESIKEEDDRPLIDCADDDDSELTDDYDEFGMDESEEE